MFKVDDVEIRKISEMDINRAGDFLRFINGIISDDSNKTSFCVEREIEYETNWLREVITLCKQKKMLQMVALNCGEVVGMCDITLLSERKSHVGDFGIALLRDYRGKKLGRRLAEITIKEGAQFFGEAFMVLKVCFPSSKSGVKKFYESLGFAVVAVVPDQYLFETLEPELVMLRRTKKEVLL